MGANHEMRTAQPRKRKGRGQRPHHAVAEGDAIHAGAEPLAVQWLGILAGLALMPLLGVTVSAFWQCLSLATLEHAFWKSAEFWFFHVGAICWLVCLAGFGGRVFHVVYVFGHEWTHALAALCCGGRLLRCPVISASGGHVVTDRSNLFIILAPYFIPIYSVIAGLVFGIAGFVFRLPEEVLWIWYSVLGFTWAFHATFTIRMAKIRQPDFEKGGRFFCLVAIALANLWLLCLLLVVASPNISLEVFLQLWMEQSRGACQAVSRILGA